MSIVIFTKDGLFKEEEIKKNKKWVKVRKRVKKKLVWTHLREVCEIEEGVTLLDIFRTVDQYVALKAFLAQYSWCSYLEAFHAQASEPNYEEADEDRDERLEYLEVYWACSYDKSGRKVWVGSTPAFHGKGFPSEEGRKYFSDGRIHYGIDFSPMYSLAHLPVKLNKEVKFWEPLDEQNLMKERLVLVEGEQCFSLLEVLDAIYDEISFHGDPQAKRDKWSELKQTVEGIKSGEIKTVPWDLDAEIKRLEDDLEEDS